MLNKFKVLTFLGIVYTLFSTGCSSSSDKENTPDAMPILSQHQVDSMIEKTGNFPARTNAHATLENKKWTSTSFAVNTTLVNGKKTFSIFLTDGHSKIVMNYSGPQQPGLTPTGDLLQASFLDDNNHPYPCTEGLIEFTRFDTLAKLLSGNFKLHCREDKDLHSTKTITDATFTELPWK